MLKLRHHRSNENYPWLESFKIITFSIIRIIMSDGVYRGNRGNAF